jgi:PucR C-terminal helix-turn-helix domain
MKGGARDRPRRQRSLAELRAATAERLRRRREEIYEAVIHRAFSVAPPDGREAPGYVEALRTAIPAAVEHAFDTIEVGEERVGPTPEAVLAQAGASARSEVGLEVVMRRYAAGYSTISDFLHQEVRALGAGSTQGYTVLQRELTALFDRFVAEVSEVYRREEARAIPSSRQRRLERIRRLLTGELVDPAGLDYPIEGSHLSAIVTATEPEAAAVDLARRLERRLLIGESSAGRCAVWFGGTRSFDPREIDSVIPDPDLRIALGDPGRGLSGWRRSRRQAESADLIGRRGGSGIVCYRDVAFMAAAVRDPDLAHFLRKTYLEPLGEEEGVLRRTLLTYLELNRNASSAAAALGIARQTVTSRIRLAEKKLGRPPEECGTQLETALRLAELGDL